MIIEALAVSSGFFVSLGPVVSLGLVLSVGIFVSFSTTTVVSFSTKVSAFVSLENATKLINPHMAKILNMYFNLPLIVLFAIFSIISLFFIFILLCNTLFFTLSQFANLHSALSICSLFHHFHIQSLHMLLPQIFLCN